jgi:hypothetical protein
MANTDKPCCTGETCFACRFWLEKVQWAEDGDQYRQRGQQTGTPVARVNGRHYMVKPYNTTSPPQFLGFGGAVWTFRFHDGRTITSNDVMTQGEIPARFRDRLPDNAVLVPQTPMKPKSPFGAKEGTS